MSQDFNYQEALLQCKTMEDITGKDGLVQKIIKDAVEHILGQELEDYISQKNSSGDKVSRNGSTTKNIKTAYGNIGVRVPRTREPGFEPEVAKKRAVIDEGLEPQITSNVIYFREIPFFKQKFPFSTSNSNFFLFILFYKISLDKIRKMCGRFRF